MPLPSPIESDGKLADKADVVIIGGGIAGIATALELAEHKCSVVC